MCSKPVLLLEFILHKRKYLWCLFICGKGDENWADLLSDRNFLVISLVASIYILPILFIFDGSIPCYCLLFI